MRKLYGDLMRSDAGVTRTLKTVAERNVPSEVRKVVREVQGTLDKVRDEASDAVLDFVRSGASANTLHQLTVQPPRDCPSTRERPRCCCSSRASASSSRPSPFCPARADHQSHPLQS